LHPYVIADVFTDTPLEGNQVAVFTDAPGLGDELMQRTARELNLSETVFVIGARDDADAEIRIFTPGTELPFAGHPVLGTAFVLGQRLGGTLVRLATRAGVISVELRRDGDAIVYGEMGQPIPTREDFERAEELLAALGVARSELPVQAYSNGPVHVYVALDSEQAVAELRPDLGALAELGPLNISCFAGQGSDFKTRMFAPGIGVAEDPATGSAAGPLAVHLARHGWIGYGQDIAIRQGAEIRRPSLLRARVDGTAEALRRVAVGGTAVIVAWGEYRLD
jgi:trans-2,3-dihydro-3-hydroxyanthranilate isomerase